MFNSKCLKYQVGPTGPLGPTGPQGPAGSTSYAANSAIYDGGNYNIHDTFLQLLGSCYNGGGQMAAQGVFIGGSRNAINFIYTNDDYLSFRFYNPKASDKIGYISINDFMDKRGWSLDGTSLYITT